MKKIVALLLALVMVLAFAACGTKPVETPNEPDAPVETPNAPAETPDAPVEETPAPEESETQE